MSLKLNSSGGGSITLQEPSTASNRTLTLPDNTGNLISSADSGTVSQAMLASGVAGTGPAFHAYANTDQNVTNNVATKVTLGTEVFDTDNCFADSRFTPNVAGYYQINASLRAATPGSTTTSATVRIYKNGTEYASFPFITPATGVVGAMGSIVLYLNGTTDYVEFYGTVNGTTPLFDYATVGGTSHFSGCLVRAA